MTAAYTKLLRDHNAASHKQIQYDLKSKDFTAIEHLWNLRDKDKHIRDFTLDISIIIIITR